MEKHNATTEANGFVGKSVIKAALLDKPTAEQALLYRLTSMYDNEDIFGSQYRVYRTRIGDLAIQTSYDAMEWAKMFGHYAGAEFVSD